MWKQTPQIQHFIGHKGEFNPLIQDIELVLSNEVSVTHFSYF